ncbi:MAG: hypothetical protein WCG92_07270 [Hyphomicrobiales bacterium]
MNRRILFIACTCALLAAGVVTALAQAGSTGGAIGKQNKSAVGADDAAPRAQPPARPARPARPRAEPGADAQPGAMGPNAASLDGHWTVNVSCADGTAVWSFDIQGDSDSHFTGVYDGGGKITGGEISGNSVTILTQYYGQRAWYGTLSRSGKSMKIQGTVTGGGVSTAWTGNCKFVATKG